MPGLKRSLNTPLGPSFIILQSCSLLLYLPHFNVAPLFMQSFVYNGCSSVLKDDGSQVLKGCGQNIFPRVMVARSFKD